MEVAIPRGDQNPLAVQQTGRLDVGQPIAHPPGPREVDVERRRSFAKQFEAGFAAVAGTADLRVMRAEVGAVDARALQREQFAEPPLHSGIVVDGVATPRDTGLVGDDDNAVTGVIQAPNRLGSARQQFDLFRLVQKPLILDDGAVAVEEERPTAAVSHLR